MAMFEVYAKCKQAPETDQLRSIIDIVDKLLFKQQ